MHGTKAVKGTVSNSFDVPIVQRTVELRPDKRIQAQTRQEDPSSDQTKQDPSSDQTKQDPSSDQTRGSKLRSDKRIQAQIRQGRIKA